VQGAASLFESKDYWLLCAWTGGAIVLASAFVWPVWVWLVRIFLPNHLGKALLDWQRAPTDDRLISSFARN
jgi:hypothetical protein